MNASIKTIYLKTKKALAENELNENAQERSKAAINILENALSDLRRHVIDTGFDNDAGEIEFFKEIKPEIVSLEIQESKIYSILVNKPIGTTEQQVKYFEDELLPLQSFFRANIFYYQYYRNGLTVLDDTYFLRKAILPLAPFPEITDTDTEFSTPISSLFARFHAYEQIQRFLLDQIAIVNHPELILNNGSPAAAGLKWTGDTINLVELIYGLWLTGQFNNGNASLNQIVRWVEVNLSVNIGIIQRRFSEIERRKRLSVTKFIDQMKKTIEEKIERGNS